MLSIINGIPYFFPIALTSEIGKNNGIPLIIDNTASPVICKPFDHGAAIVVYSLTKYIGGHGNSIGGLIIDGGNFDWEGAGKKRQPALNTPDPSYGGAVWVDAVKPLGPIAYIIKARVTLLRDLGGALSPFNAFLILQGLETISLRMKTHCENASKVAYFLENHKSVDRVIYPELQTGTSKKNAEKYLNIGFGGLVGFELKGGAEAGKKFIDNLNLFYHVANIGDSRSLAIHPATTTHSQLSNEDKLKSGVSDSYVRLSVGIEHIDDIIDDLTLALDKSQEK